MKHLSKEQRYAISVMYKENKTQTEMAKAIGVSKSTICRELKRNTRPHGKVYNHEEAHHRHQNRPPAEETSVGGVGFAALRH
ncbi:MAG: helix-turn-helix domain-containing protein [Bacteroidales bacterium]|nr:helix-turn-helix domain-containing protein [Bacteroidales bacterium]